MRKVFVALSMIVFGIIGIQGARASNPMELQLMYYMFAGAKMVCGPIIKEAHPDIVLSEKMFEMLSERARSFIDPRKIAELKMNLRNASERDRKLFCLTFAQGFPYFLENKRTGNLLAPFPGF